MTTGIVTGAETVAYPLLDEAYCVLR
jgi:hypothetical protein